MEQCYELSEAELNSMAYHNGLLQAKIEGLVELVLTVLELRAIPLDDLTEARIRSCREPQLLERWVERAKQAEDLAGVF